MAAHPMFCSTPLAYLGTSKSHQKQGFSTTATTIFNASTQGNALKDKLVVFTDYKMFKCAFKVEKKI
jgi:hypothetical protein